jgi:preprotein translocase subunit SecF
MCCKGTAKEDLVFSIMVGDKRSCDEYRDGVVDDDVGDFVLNWMEGGVKGMSPDCEQPEHESDCAKQKEEHHLIPTTTEESGKNIGVEVSPAFSHGPIRQGMLDVLVVILLVLVVVVVTTAAVAILGLLLGWVFITWLLDWLSAVVFWPGVVLLGVFAVNFVDGSLA